MADSCLVYSWRKHTRYAGMVGTYHTDPVADQSRLADSAWRRHWIVVWILVDAHCFGFAEGRNTLRPYTNGTIYCYHHSSNIFADLHFLPEFPRYIQYTPT